MIDLQNIEDAQKLAQAIVNTIPEPFIVLDGEIRVLAASRSFYETFKVDPEQTRGRQKDVLLQEMQHRVANSLQIIASILLLKARAVTSEETRLHLQDAHQRVMSVAEVQRHLHTSNSIDQIEVGSYLTKLCGSLAASMVGENNPITLNVTADAGWIGSDKAVSLGLIVTELVINAIKYAFPSTKSGDRIAVTYEINKADWKLIVSDNGIGKNTVTAGETAGGLGTANVQALVKQLDARMDVASSANGTSVSITRATFTSRIPREA